jgi:hypothetical protein
MRPEFTAFGQTIWSLTNQARFTAAAVCDTANTPIFTLMGQVENDQRWGLGFIPNTRFKGERGPHPPVVIWCASSECWRRRPG